MWFYSAYSRLEVKAAGTDTLWSTAAEEPMQIPSHLSTSVSKLLPQSCKHQASYSIHPWSESPSQSLRSPKIHQHTIVSRTVQLILLHFMSPVFVLPDARLFLSGEVGESLLNTTKEILEDLPRRPQRCRNNGEASARSG